MIVIDKKRLLFNVKLILNCDGLFDVDGCSRAMFRSFKLNEQNNGLKDFICDERLTSIIDLDEDLDTLWQNMSKDSCRNSIKRAEKKGVRVLINQNLDRFYGLYKKEVKQKKYTKFIESYDTIKDHGTLFTAVLDDELLAGHVYIEDKGSMLFYIGASNRSDTDKKRNSMVGNASHMIHWEAMKYAKRKNIKVFDLGGLFAKEGKDYPGYSIDAFKKSFGGKTTPVYFYYKDYSKLYKMAKIALRSFNI